jgi:NADPH:quinone reductase-like Zn-dependent oxidoreductase
MRAIVQRGYGDPRRVLEVRDVPTPRPDPGEVRVRVQATSVHPDVWHVITGHPRVLRVMGSGLRRPDPPVPGTEVAGEVAEVGAGVTRWRPGDVVFGETITGMQWRNGGAYAASVVVAADALAAVPAGVEVTAAATVTTAGLIVAQNVPELFEAAAAVGPAGPVAAGAPRWRRVLVNGAGGGVGTIVVQLAHATGAQVTAVDLAAKHELLQRLGADRVVDHTVQDVTRDTEPYDLVVDVVGSHPYAAFRRILTRDGDYVLIGHDGFGSAGHGWVGNIPRMLGLMARSTVDRRLSAATAFPDRRAAMQRLHDLLAAGALTPVVERTYPLEQAADAIARLASGDAAGRLVLVP